MRRISQHLWNGHEEKEMEKKTHTHIFPYTSEEMMEMISSCIRLNTFTV